MANNCLYKYNGVLYTEPEFKQLLNSNLLQFVYSLDSADINNILDPAFQFMEQDETSWINTIFKTSYPKEIQDRVKFLYTVVNSNKWGTWGPAGITLYKSSARGTGYHEAWHEFSQMFLTKDEKISLYKEAIVNIPALKDLNYKKLNDLRQIEEHLADDFMKYMLNDELFGDSLLVNRQPVRNSIFRIILNFLKGLFGVNKQNEDVFLNRLNTLYSNLRNGELDNYQFSVDNILFNEQLHRKIEGFDNLSAVLKNKSEVGTMMKVMGHFDALITEVIKNKQVELTKLFADPKLKVYVYTHVKNRLKQELKTVRLSPEAVEMREFILANFGEFVKAHDEKGSLKFAISDVSDIENVIKILDSNDDINNDNEEDDDHVDNSSSGRDKAWDKSGNEEDSKDIASKIIRFMVASLHNRRFATPEEQKQGKKKLEEYRQSRLQGVEDNETMLAINDEVDKLEEENNYRYISDALGLKELVNFNTVWNMLQTELQGMDNYSDMYRKIEALSVDKVYLLDLLKLLPSPNKEVYTQDESHISNRFRTDFMRVKNPILINSMVVERNEEGDVKQVRIDLLSANKLGIKTVRETFYQKWLETKSAKENFVTEKDDEIIFDFDKFAETFYGKDGDENFKNIYLFKNAESLSEEFGEGKIDKIYNNRITFLNAFGFIFSDQTVKTQEFKDFIMNRVFMEDQLGKYLFNDIANLIEYRKKEGAFIIDNLAPGTSKSDREKALETLPIIKNPLDFFRTKRVFRYSDRSIKNPVILNGNSNKMDELYNFEILHSGQYFNEATYTATQKIQFENSIYNTFFMYLNGLNDAVKYPTYQSLVAEGSPYEYNYNIDRNPHLRSSIWFNSMFELDVPEGTPRYGKRRIQRIKKQGLVNKTNHVTVDFVNLSGMSINDRTANNFEGQNTVKLETLDRMISSISSLLTTGTSELMRHADKSMAYGIRPTSMFINGSYTGDKNIFFELKSDLTSGDFVSTIFNTDKETNNLHNVFAGYLKSEMERIFKVRMLEKSGNNEFIDKKISGTERKRLQGFILFDKLLSVDVKNALYEKIEQIVNSKEANLYAEKGNYQGGLEVLLDEMISTPVFVEEINKNVSRLNPEITLSIATYLDQSTQDYEKRMIEKGYIKNTLGKFLPSSLSVDDTSVIRTFILNQFIHNVEQSKLIYGDPAFYTAPFKRLPMFTSTGAMPNVSAEHIAQMNNDVNLNAYTKALGYNSIPFSDKVKSTVLSDVELDTKVSDRWKKAFEILKMTPEAIEKLTSDYSDVNEADAQGMATIDFYRSFKKSIGFWYDSHENAYNKMVEYEKSKKEFGKNPTKNQIKQLEGLRLTAEEEGLFPPIKLGYGGPLVNEHLYAPTYHKFSIYPILPSMTEENNNLNKINRKLLREGISYLTFESASKVANTGKNGKFQPLYSDVATRTLNDAKFHPTVTLLKYYKEQLQIEPKDERSMTFGTQFRKLLFSNLYEHGYPTDFVSTSPESDWDRMSEEERINASEIHKNHQGYLKVLNNVAEIELEKLLEEIGGTQNSNGEIVINDFRKLKDMVINEAKKKEAPDSLEYFFQINEDGSLKYPIETSKDKKIIQDILLSLVNNRLVRLKINGANLVQAAQTGHERYDGKTYSDTLEGYRVETTPEGKFILRPMEVEVSFNNSYRGTLKLIHPDGKVVKTVKRLNEAMRNAEWYETHKDYFSLVGYRIPTQSTNSIAYMGIKQFLPKNSMNLIVLPSEITKIAGSDFDIDKMSVIRPYFNKRGEILRPSELNLSRAELKENIAELEEELTDLRNSKKRFKGDVNKALSKIQDQTATVSDWAIYKYNTEETSQKLEVLLDEEEEILNLIDNSYDSDMAELFQKSGLVQQTEKNEEQDTSSLEAKLNYVQKQIDKISEFAETMNSYVDDYNALPEETISAIETELEGYMEWFAQLDEKRIKLEDLKDAYAHQKEAQFNNLLDIAKNSISREDKFIDLVTPNSVDIVKKQLADPIKEWLTVSGQESFAQESNTTDIFNPAYEDEVYESFLQGKSTLGIAALAGPLSQIFQRTGAYVNPVYHLNKQQYDTVVLLNTNKREISRRGETITVYDLASRYDSEGKILKSELIAQYINAYVDIAKEPFVFYMNAGINVAPVMMYMTHLGVPAKQSAYLVNQPSIRDYIKRKSVQASYTNRYTNEMSKKEEYTKMHSLIETFNKFVIGDENIKDIGEYITINPKNNQIRKIDFGRIYEEFNTYLKNNAPQYEKLLSQENLEKNIKGELSEEESKNTSMAAFLQYTMLENQSASLREINDVLKSDTTMSKSTTSAVQHTKKVQQYKNNKIQGILPAEVISKILSSTEITPYVVQPKIASMYSGIEKVQNHPVIQQHLDELLNMGRTKKSPVIQEKIIKDYFSDLNSFILQNHGVQFNETKNTPRTLDSLWPLMINDKSKRLKKNKELYKKEIKNIVTRLNDLHAKYNGVNSPINLRTRYQIFNGLKVYNSEETNLRSIAWQGEPLKKDLINMLSEEWTKLANLNDPKFADIKEFMIDLAKVVFLTHGETRSSKSFFALVPSELHTSFMLPFIEDFLSEMNVVGSNYYQLFTKFFNDDFMGNNKQYFKGRGTDKINDGRFKQYRRDSSFARDYILTAHPKVEKIKREFVSDPMESGDERNDNETVSKINFKPTPAEQDLMSEVESILSQSDMSKFEPQVRETSMDEKYEYFKSLNKNTLTKKELTGVNNVIDVLQKYKVIQQDKLRASIPVTPTFNPDFFQSVDSLFQTDFSVDLAMSKIKVNFEEYKDALKEEGINSIEELESYPDKNNFVLKICKL